MSSTMARLKRQPVAIWPEQERTTTSVAQRSRFDLTWDVLLEWISLDGMRLSSIGLESEP